MINIIECIKQYVDDKKTIKEIAINCNVGTKQIRRILLENNVKIRNNRNGFIIDLTGKKINKWTILEFIGNSKDSIWLCQCDCGFIKKQTRGVLVSNQSKQCRKCASKSITNIHQELTTTIHNKFASGAKKRNINFTVSKEYCWELFLKQNKKCALSGLDIEFATTASGHNHHETTASLDRIDSSKGYIQGNVQWIHKHINRMKWCFSQEYFIQLCRLISIDSNHINISDIKIKNEYRNKTKINVRQKLTDNEVREIRLKSKKGIKNKDLANEYNTTPGNISYIVKGLSRKNV